MSGDPNGIRGGLKRAADEAAPRAIDLDAVLAASRARRRARRTAVVGAGSAAATLLAVGGLVMGLQNSGLLASPAGSAPDSASIAESPMEAREESADGYATESMLAPPEKVNSCGAPVAEATDAAGGSLSVAVEPLVAVPTGGGGSATVTVTNTGPATVRGDVRLAPALSIADDGVTVWHSNGVVPPETVAVALAPGESIQLEGHVEAVSCTHADEAAEAFPPGLPPLTPGAYGVTAVVVFVVDGTGAVEYLIAPLAPLTVE